MDPSQPLAKPTPWKPVTEGGAPSVLDPRALLAAVANGGTNRQGMAWNLVDETEATFYRQKGFHVSYLKVSPGSAQAGVEQGGLHLKLKKKGGPKKPRPPVVHNDGYTWRKFGQKILKKSAVSTKRHYYRCIEKGCEAKKLMEHDPYNDPEEKYLCSRYIGTHNHEASKSPSSRPPKHTMVVTPPTSEAPTVQTDKGELGQGSSQVEDPEPCENDRATTKKRRLEPSEMLTEVDSPLDSPMDTGSKHGLTLLAAAAGTCAS